MGATFTWGRGRLLTKYAKYSTTINFVYDANGIRSGKLKTSVNGVLRTTYLYDSEGRLRVEIIATDNKYYLYSADGIIGYVQDGQRYLYRKNLFGDITAIYQGETKLAEYEYDAWGNCTITLDTNSVGKNNPFRYRGYYWDNDIKLYYLMSRYYDPKTGRFINADSFEYLEPKAINGLNLYAYCRNNPIMYVDPNGHFLIELGVVAFFVVSAGGIILLFMALGIYVAIITQGSGDDLEQSEESDTVFPKPDEPLKEPNPPSVDTEFVSDISENLLDLGVNINRIIAPVSTEVKYFGPVVGGGGSLWDPVLQSIFNESFTGSFQ